MLNPVSTQFPLFIIFLLPDNPAPRLLNWFLHQTQAIEILPSCLATVGKIHGFACLLALIGIWGLMTPTMCEEYGHNNSVFNGLQYFLRT